MSRVPRRSIAATAIVSLGSLGGLAACAAIIGLEPLEFVTTDSGSVDGAGPQDDATSNDARGDGPAGDGGPVARRFSCAELYDAGVDGGEVVFCDDFERAPGLIVEGWTLTRKSSAATIELTDAQARSGAQSIHFMVPAEDGGIIYASIVQLAVDGGPTLVMEGEVYVEPSSEPSTGVTWANMGSVAVEEYFSALLSQPDGGAFTPFLSGGDVPVLLEPRRWHHFTFQETSTGTTLVMSTPEDGKLVVRQLSVAPGAPPDEYWIGAHNGVTSIYFDELVLHR
jgi:hypothetical protein